jgi:transposase
MTSRGAEKMNNDTIGVDVSKDHLDADRLADGASRRFANDKCGRKAFVKWFAQTPVQRVVFEPTGPYHRAFERALGAAGVPCVKVNPVRPAASPRRSASWPRPIAWMRRCWRAWAQC